MLILHSSLQLNPLSGYLERSTEFLWPNCASAGLQLPEWPWNQNDPHVQLPM